MKIVTVIFVSFLLAGTANASLNAKRHNPEVIVWEIVNTYECGGNIKMQIMEQRTGYGNFTEVEGYLDSKWVFVARFEKDGGLVSARFLQDGKWKPDVKLDSNSVAGSFLGLLVTSGQIAPTSSVSCTDYVHKDDFILR